MMGLKLSGQNKEWNVRKWTCIRLKISGKTETSSILGAFFIFVSQILQFFLVLG